MLNCDAYLMPEALDEALGLMAEHAGRHRVVAGATDTLPWAREGRAGDVHVPVIIDVSRVAEMRGAELRGGRLWLGASTTFQNFLTNPLLVEQAPVMPKVSVWFADDQIRGQATLAGNIINASPAADGTPAMIAMNGAVNLAWLANGERRTRQVQIQEFVTGPGKTMLEAGELLTSIECDALAGYGAAFEKVGYRRSLVISTVCVAALVRLDNRHSTFEDVRLGLAGVGPVPSRLDECEEFLAGKSVQADVIREAALLPVERVQSRTRQDYRREVLVNFVARAIADAVRDLGVALEADETPRREASYG